MSRDLESRILEELRHLPDDKQSEVLTFVCSLGSQRLPKGVAGNKLLRFAGAIATDDLERMSIAIEQDCERVDVNEW